MRSPHSGAQEQEDRLNAEDGKLKSEKRMEIPKPDTRGEFTRLWRRRRRPGFRCYGTPDPRRKRSVSTTGNTGRETRATRGKLVISILAGKKLATLAKTFPHARALVRAMPNLPGSIGAGIVGWSSLAPLSEADRATALGVLGALGAVHSFPEEMLDSVTALGGSGPGFVFEFAAALREAGVAAGFTRELAAEFATEVLLGSAKLLKQSGEDADVLRDRVTSPKGTTYAGLEAMKSANFRDTMRATILAARDRSRELSKDS